MLGCRLSRAGLKRDTGVLNFSSCGLGRPQSAQASPITAYSADGAWDAAFVMASSESITVQNTLAARGLAPLSFQWQPLSYAPVHVEQVAGCTKTRTPTLTPFLDLLSFPGTSDSACSADSSSAEELLREMGTLRNVRELEESKTRHCRLRRSAPPRVDELHQHISKRWRQTMCTAAQDSTLFKLTALRVEDGCTDDRGKEIGSSRAYT
jgi:hypothetical protein